MNTDTSYCVEPYAGGFMIARYGPGEYDAAFCGRSMTWRRQPLVRDPFDDREAAEEAMERARDNERAARSGRGT
jgi:hypothetical protein